MATNSKPRKAPVFVDLPTTFTVKTSKVAPKRAGHGRGASETYKALARIVAGAVDGKPRSLDNVGTDKAVHEALGRHLRRAAAENHNQGVKVQSDGGNLIFQLTGKPPVKRPRSNGS